MRYQSFANENEFKEMIQKRQPEKIDIGGTSLLTHLRIDSLMFSLTAIFTHPPKLHDNVNSQDFKPLERELVFDVDMTDYDDVRTCCTGANICHRCWPFMTMALKVVDTSLREDFAYKHIVWIYSGRRGIHCWVCDPEARLLTDEGRAAIINYFTWEQGKTGDKKSEKKYRNHPAFKRAYDILEPYFEKYIVDEEGQALLATRNQQIRLLNELPDEAVSIREDLDSAWAKDKSLSGIDKWNQLKNAITKSDNNGKQINKKQKIDAKTYERLDAWKMELVFKYCYPKLDANVSKHRNHLLKSPFCIHPKTGRVCIPIDPQVADDFDPLTVPTVRTLCEEINRYDSSHPDTTGVDDIDKTSMKRVIDLFNKTFYDDMKVTNRKIMGEDYKKRREEQLQKQDEGNAMEWTY